MPRTNDDVAAALDELARLTKVDEQDPNSFRVRAYERAARAVESLSTDVTDMSASALAKVSGIGKSTAAKIRQFVDDGHIDKLESLREKYPPGQLQLLQVPGLGPKMLGLLDEVLGVRDLDGLRGAIADGSFADLPGLGDKTAENLAKAIERMHLASKTSRRPVAEVLPVAERLVADLADLDAVEEVAWAGSLRRFRETIGDVDLLATLADGADAEDVMAAFRDHDLAAEVVGSGTTKTSIVTRDGLSVDLRVVPPASFGAALVYFTGSKAHNIALRQRAIERGWKLSEYDLADAESGEVVAGATEEEVYAALDLAWVTPELREDVGEVQRAAEDTLPERVEVAHLRGDLHVHTDWSGDGRETLDAMVAALVERGLDYAAITDHAEDLRINGISREGMLEQRRVLRALEESRGDIRLFHGTELNIGVDGSLDYDQDFLDRFDFCVASVHSHFTRPVAEQTERLVTAIRNPAVNVIGHLTGRKLGRRPGIELDLEPVFAACVETGTALEMNAALPRLDASVDVVRAGIEAGVTFVISTDSHAIRELDRARHGAAQARRAGLAPDGIANTRPTADFEDWVASVRSGG
ncbi:DNA polymerase/3'-5' exonuclease PolX [Salsipaludibacter albus]|uniref:DNA polymerase/3'-5' exonuclease PolX n=1 Tax=Salsipaludibacter albus TaxID=2849650 RepID=UPI001EE4A6B6|nr:DNA polymerase/3'-5' exonuclease PolX [Salsipaludibacter albus]MBY5163806.1 DNA polymerase/3'-5' exonuclease PolX [Salsipaludibacter albus]